MRRLPLILCLILIPAICIASVFIQSVSRPVVQPIVTDIFGESGAVPTFRFEVKTAGADTFTLPIYNGGAYDFKVVWGDGNSDTITAFDDAAVTHSYAGAGTYDVEITGTITGFRFNDGVDKDLIYDISEWGCLSIITSGTFYGCNNGSISAVDTLNTDNATDLSNSFRGFGTSSRPTTFALRMSDTSQVTNFYRFIRQNNFLITVSLPDFDSSAATNISEFSRDNESVTSFDGIGDWDISSVNSAATFLGASCVLPSVDYNAILIGWAAQIPLNNFSVDFGGSKYSAGAAATAHAALIADGVTITDGGLE